MVDAPHFATPAADQLFEQSASPEEIAAELDKTLAAARRAERRADWLRALLAHRTAEKAAGIWPPAREDDLR